MYTTNFCGRNICELKQSLADLQFMFFDLNVGFFAYLMTAYNNLEIATDAVSSPCLCYLHTTPSNHN